jgi:co-chaperonin GroES (HSP10)
MAGNKIDKLVRGMKAKLDWVLLITEDMGNESEGGIVLTNAPKTPFSRVLSVGPGVGPEICEVGDRVIFREGMALNKKDEVRMTVGNYLFVHKTNILGVAAKEESLQAGSSKENGTVEAAT